MTRVKAVPRAAFPFVPGRPLYFVALAPRARWPTGWYRVTKVSRGVIATVAESPDGTAGAGPTIDCDSFTGSGGVAWESEEAYLAEQAALGTRRALDALWRPGRSPFDWCTAEEIHTIAGIVSAAVARNVLVRRVR